MKKVWSGVMLEELDIAMTFNGGRNNTTEQQVYDKYHSPAVGGNPSKSSLTAISQYSGFLSEDILASYPTGS